MIKGYGSEKNKRFFITLPLVSSRFIQRLNLRGRLFLTESLCASSAPVPERVILPDSRTYARSAIVERHFGVLLNQKNGSARVMQFLDYIKYLLNKYRRQAH